MLGMNPRPHRYEGPALTAEVQLSESLGVSTHSLYKWMKMYAKPASQASSVDQEAENRRLKRELARMTEERDILKKAAAYFAKDVK